MFSHNYSVFANSCIKPPLNSSTRLPNPSYLKPKYETMKEGKSKNPGLKKSKKQFSSMMSLSTENNNFLSLKDFYESIPDYNDLHHLSQLEFYKQIDCLKRKSDELKSSCFADDYFKGVWSKIDTPETNLVDFSVLDNKNYSSKHFNELNNYKFSEYPPRMFGECKAKSSRKGSAKSVRIESDPVPYINPHDDNPTRIFKKSLRSKSASPVRAASGLAVEPFNMTQKEDDEKAFDDLVFQTNNFLAPDKTTKYKTSPVKIKTNPIPITSKIPLFKQIMEDKEHKSQLAKLDAAMELNSKIKPFGFDNGPDRSNSRCLRRSLSYPELSTTPEPLKQFKANPIPKNLNSNYFRQKMDEEDYFRKINKKIRAEELLKISSLPPSMRRREKNDKKKFDTQNSYQPATRKPKRKRKSKKSRILSSSTNRTSSQSNMSKEEFITTSTHPFNLETERRGKERPRKQTPTSTSSSTKTNTTFSFKTQFSPRPMYPVSRPNLAATLRYEHTRNRMREFMERPPSVLSGSVKPFKWNVKKTPGWQSLSYDPTHEEELQLRLATRQAEQKLRQEEYKMAKEMMIQRVKAAPLLLEGPTYWGPKVGQLSHHCGSERASARTRPDSSIKRPTSSKLSNYSDSKASGLTKIVDLSEKCHNDYDDYDCNSSEIEEHI